MTEIVIRFDVPEAAVADFAPVLHQIIDALAPVVQQVGGTGEVLIDGQPLEPTDTEGN